MKIGVIMDPITSIHIAGDTTFAFMLEAQKRRWQIFYMENKDLYLRDSVAYGHMRQTLVHDDESHWYDFENYLSYPLANLDIILMRIDPPLTMEYIYVTQILNLAEKAGVLVANRPQSLRDFNEKLFISYFPDCCPPTLVTSDIGSVKEFLQQHADIICKPLGGMGGELVFRVDKDGRNLNVIVETLTDHGKNLMIAQKYIPEVRQGDKRIILIDGKPVPYALARLPLPHEERANLHVGGEAKAVPLSKRDLFICERLRPVLQQRGLFFVGIDIIGDYLTEINITSPTCVRQLDRLCGLNISAEFLDCLEKKL